MYNFLLKLVQFSNIMNNKKIFVLGCGRVGLAIANDLKIDYEVCVGDISSDLLKAYNGKTSKLDARNLVQLIQATQDYDLIVNALPGFLGYEALANVSAAGLNVVDISFFPEKPEDIDFFCKENNIIAAIDCGVAPGLWNMILGHYSKKMKISSCKCYVGGLPLEPKAPLYYKAPFSPIDVIEEYTRPARYLEKGSVITKPALSGAESVFFDEVGELHAFNTDGLRTLLENKYCDTIIEKTLRYPGHIGLMKSMRDMGLFSKEDIEIGKNVFVSPLEITSRLLFPFWTFDKLEKDITVMRVILENDEIKRTFELFDVAQGGVMSMSRTTGFTCTAVVRAILNGHIKNPGLYSPEMIGEICYDFIIEELEKRNIKLRERIEKLC